MTSTILTPVSITALKCAGDLLAAGSADGSIRFYNLPSNKVHKAIRGLGGEISSLVFEPGGENRILWCACGQRLLQFDLSLDRMILNQSDATTDLLIKLSEEEEDLLNQIDINKTHLAFCCDSGSVGVVNLSSKQVSKMKKSHEQIAYSVSFITERPRELLSGGYDSKLHHYDYLLGNIISDYDLLALPLDEPSNQVFFVPPFIQCLALSTNRAAAAGTADGRLFIGLGGVRAPSKRQKRWEGLHPDSTIVGRVAEGPINALQWRNDNEVILVTLRGVLKRYNIGDRKVEDIHHPPDYTSVLFKANALAIHQDLVIVGGLTSDGKGVIEVVDLSLPS